jgi:regulator of replication initiation timing
MVGEDNVLEEVAGLRLENERLRSRVLRYEQSAVGLDSVQGELEYYKKLTFLQ